MQLAGFWGGELADFGVVSPAARATASRMASALYGYGRRFGSGTVHMLPEAAERGTMGATGTMKV
jgi:hypothetical protein